MPTRTPDGTPCIVWGTPERPEAVNWVQYLLVCLAEEAGEVAQATTKALRFGLDDVYGRPPAAAQTTERRIEGELADLLAVVELLEEQGVELRTNRLAELVRLKKERVREYAEYARQRGTLR